MKGRRAAVSGPRWAAGLLRLTYGRRHGDLVLAELDREYRDFVRPSRRHVSARLWYLRQVLGSVAWKLPRGNALATDRLRRVRSIDTLLTDLRYAVRALRATPNFTLLAVVTIALGIGSSTAVFSVLNGIVLAPLPYPQPERLVRLWGGTPVSKAVSEQLGAQTRSFAPLAGSVEAGRTLTGVEEPVELYGLEVTPSFFAMLGAAPLLGRTFVEEETHPGAGTSVILSHGVWQRIFGADTGVLGRRIELGGSAATIVGVMPGEHRPLIDGVEFWAPMEIDRNDYSDYHGTAQVGLVGRLAEGVSLEAATADVAAVAEAIRERSPDAYSEDWVAGSAPRPLHDWIVADTRTALWTSMAAALLMLLIACANVANLMLARSTRRGREIAIRIGLGARPLRVARQTLTESLVLGLAGGAGGAALTFLLLEALAASWPSGLPLTDNIRIEPAVLGFALAASVLSSLVFGVAPAWRAARLDPQPRLKEGGLSATSGRATRLNRVLVAAEIALAVMLVIAAGVMLRSLNELARVDPGFEVSRITTFRVRLPDSGRYTTHVERDTYYRQLGDSIRAVPGVAAYGGVTFLPMATGVPSASYRVAGVTYPDGEVPPTCAFQLVTGDYFRALGIPLLRGRLFEPTDRDDAPIVGVINAKMAHQAFGDEDALGKTVNMFGGVDFTVVGVVGNSRQRSPAQEPSPEAFFSFSQISWWPSMYVTVRAEDDRAPSVADLRRAVWAIDAQIPISRVRPLQQVVESAASRPRFFTGLLAIIGAMAMTLGAIGVYGVTSYAVGHQVHEYGIRLALGAPTRAILRNAVWRGLTPVLAGTAAGTLGALAVAGLLRGMLFGVAARDPLTFALVVVMLVMVGVTACFLPARRAASIDPARTLRSG